MRTVSTAVVAALLISAGAAWSQPTADTGGVDPSPAREGPYAGAGSSQRFYDVSQRIDHLQGEIQQGGLPRGQARRASSQLAAIKSELQFRIARKHGQLLDWDRELITQKLDAFVGRYPALAGAPG